VSLELNGNEQVWVELDLVLEADIDLGELRDFMSKRFDMEELKVLVFDIGVNWDEVAGDWLSVKIASLIGYLQRTGRLGELFEHHKYLIKRRYI
jgi:hypothetical protein